MSSEDLKTAWKEFCESSEHEKKVQYLDKFLDLLIDSTPLDIPLVSKLNFGKHQVISGYIGSHFLIDLGKLCGNSSYPYFEQQKVDNSQIVNRGLKQPIKNKSLQLNVLANSPAVKKRNEAKQQVKKSKPPLYASGGAHKVRSGSKDVENIQAVAEAQVNDGLNQCTLKEFLTANENAADGVSLTKGGSMEVEESVQSFVTTDQSHSNESRSEESISSAKISRIRLPLSSDAHKLKMSAGPVPVFSDKAELPNDGLDRKLGKIVDFVSSNESCSHSGSSQSGSNELFSDASDLADTSSKNSKASMSSLDVDKTVKKGQIESIDLAAGIYLVDAGKKVEDNQTEAIYKNDEIEAVGHVESVAGQPEAGVGKPGAVVVGQAKKTVTGQAEEAVAGQAEKAVAGQAEEADAGQAEKAVACQVEEAVGGQVEEAVGGQVEEAVVGQAVVNDEFEKQPEQKHLEDKSTTKPLDRMHKIIKFLCEGRGAKILMALDQIGVVGSATGFHIMKSLGYVFEHLLDEMMIQRIDLKIHEPFDIQKYDSMILKIQLKDLFKPLIFPPVPPPMHPTTRVEDIINKDSAQIAAANFASQKIFSTPRRHVKKTKIIKKAESGSWLQNVDKRSVANSLYYSNNLQFCECFHLESILKSKKTRSDSHQMRPKTLCEVCLMETILSLMTQFSLFDPFSKSIVIQSSRNSKYIFEFNIKILSKISEALQKQGFCDSLALNITGKFGHSLIKMLFAACQNFVKNVASYQQLSTLNVPNHYYKWVELLNTVKENVLGIAICNIDHSKFDLFVINSMTDCVSGVFSLLIEMTCDREEPLFENKETQVMKNFLSNGNLNFLESIVQMLMNDDKFSTMAPVVSCCIAKFVVYLKLWKGDYPHKIHCSDISHKSCNSTIPNSHHFAQYGNLKDSANCLIAIPVSLLLKVIGSIDNVTLCKYVVDLCKRCGVCCCMNLSTILQHLLNNFESRPMEVQNSILSLISSILLFDYNGQMKKSIEDNVDCTSCQEELENENSNNTESGRWSGLSLYYKYLFIESVATLVSDHLAIVMRNCKPQIIGKIYSILLKKVMETLMERSFVIFQNMDVNNIVVGNLTKCICLCFSTEYVILTKSMKDNALAVLNHGLNHNGTKKEMYDLLCCLVSHEQTSLEQNVQFLEDFSTLETTFSNILSREVSDLTESWQRRFVFQQNKIIDDNLNLTPIVNVYSDAAKMLGKSENREILCRDTEQSQENILSSTFEDASLDYSESFGQKIHEVGFVFPSTSEVTFNESEDMLKSSKMVLNKSLEEGQIKKPSFLVTSVKSKISDHELFSLFQLYSRIALLWHSISNTVVKSKSFRAFFSSPVFRDDLIFLISNLMTHLAKDCNGASKSTYVVQRNREETLFLCSSLLTTIVHCFQPNKDCEDSVEAFEEVRRSILNMKSTHCDFVKSLTCLLLDCASENTEKIKPSRISAVDPKIFFDTIDILQDDSSSASEGYAADSDSATPKTYKCASPISIPKVTEKPPLVCPELMIYSLDLLICHHEKFLEDLTSDVRFIKDENSSVNEISPHNIHKRKNDGENKLETDAPESKKIKNISVDECVLRFDSYTVDQSKDSNLNHAIIESNNEEKNTINLKNYPVCEKNEYVVINSGLSNIKCVAGSDGEYGNRLLVCKTSNEFSEDNVTLEYNEQIESIVSTKDDYYTQDVKILSSDDFKENEVISFDDNDEEKIKRCSDDFFSEIASDEESGDFLQENDEDSDIQLIPTHYDGKSEDDSVEPKMITIADEKGICKKKIISETEKLRTRKHKAKIHKKFISALRSKGEKGFQPLENQVTIQKIYFCEDDGNSSLDSCLPQKINSLEMLSSSKCTAPILDSNQLLAESIPTRSKHFHNSYQTGNTAPQPESSVHSTPLQMKEVSDKNCEVDHASNLFSSLANMFHICKNSKVSCYLLHNLGFLNKLISGFENLIKDNSNVYKNVIEMILDIWAEVAQWHIKPSDLSLFFGLFKSINTPSLVLCRSLSKILETTGVDPHYFLKFPCPSISLETLLKGDSISQSLLSLTSFVEVEVPISPSVIDINHLRKTHLKNNILSCVSISPVICPIPKTMDWILYSNGVSFATWVKFEARNMDRPELTVVKTDNLGPSITNIPDTMQDDKEKRFVHWRDLRTRNHIFSIGTQKLMYSVYAKPNMHKLYVSLTIEDHLETIFLDEVSVHDLGLSEQGWHHLAVVIPKVEVEKGAHTSITFIVDGLKTVSVSLRVPSMKRIERSHPSYLMVGHIDTGSLVEQEQNTEHQDTDNFWKEEELQHVRSSLKFYLTHSLSMGVTFLFRDYVLNRETCCSLMSLGKNAVNLLVPLDDSELILYPSLITKTLLQQNLNLTFLFRDLNSQLLSLRTSLLLLYSPKNYMEYTIYDKLSCYSNYSFSRTQIATLYGSLNHVCKDTSDVALLRIGGASQLVFLAARLCEMKKGSKALADCLSLLFKCCHTDPIFAMQFSTFYGSSLICRLLKSPSVPTDFLVLKVLVEGCLDTPVTKYIAKKNVYKILNIIPSLLVDRGLFNSLLVNWRCLYTTCSREYKYCCVDFNGIKLNSIGFILSVINILLQDSNPNRRFNLFQLREINALPNIISMFEEMNVEGIKLESICQAKLITDSVTRLIFGKQSDNNYGSGKDYEDSGKQSMGLVGLEVPSISGRDLKAVGDFLIFLHPDELTTVSTDRNHAYYITRMYPAAHKTGSLTNLFNLPYESEEYDSKLSQCTLQTELEDFYEEGEDALGRPASSLVKEDSTVEGDFSLIPEGKIKQSDALVSIPEKGSSDVASTMETTTFPSGSLSRDTSPENTTDAGADSAVKLTINFERHIKSFKKKTRPVVSVDKNMDDSSSDSDSIYTGTPTRKHKKKSFTEASSFNPTMVALKVNKGLGEISAVNCIVVGLINVVERSIKESADSEAIKYFSIDLPIVLANNPDATVRAAALQLFRTMLLKSPEVVQNIIFPKNVTYLIANQLYKHANATESLVSNALALALKFDPDISELSSYNCILDSEFKMCLLVPFLALLPNTVSDVTLCHNALTLLQKILTMNKTFMLRLFHKTHLMDSLLLTLRNCSQIVVSNMSDTESFDQRASSIIMDDITDICSDQIKILIASPLEQAYSTGLMLLNHLNLFTRNEADSHCFAAFLETEAAIIEVGLLRLINASVSCKRLNKSDHPMENLDVIKGTIKDFYLQNPLKSYAVPNEVSAAPVSNSPISPTKNLLSVISHRLGFNAESSEPEPTSVYEVPFRDITCLDASLLRQRRIRGRRNLSENPPVPELPDCPHAINLDNPMSTALEDQKINDEHNYIFPDDEFSTKTNNIVSPIDDNTTKKFKFKSPLKLKHFGLSKVETIQKSRSYAKLENFDVIDNYWKVSKDDSNIVGQSSKTVDYLIKDGKRPQASQKHDSKLSKLLKSPFKSDKKKEKSQAPQTDIQPFKVKTFFKKFERTKSEESRKDEKESSISSPEKSWEPISKFSLSPRYTDKRIISKKNSREIDPISKVVDITGSHPPVDQTISGQLEEFPGRLQLCSKFVDMQSSLENSINESSVANEMQSGVKFVNEQDRTLDQIERSNERDTSSIPSSVHSFNLKTIEQQLISSLKLNAQEKAKTTLYPFLSYFKFHHVDRYQSDSEDEFDSPYLDRLTNAKWMALDDKSQYPTQCPELQQLKLSGDKKLSLLDVVSRFKSLLRRSLDFIITTGPLQIELSVTLQSFMFSILEYMSVSLSHSLQVNVANKAEIGSWTQLTYLCRENLKWHFAHLLNFIVAPTMASVIREKAIKVLAEQDWMLHIFKDSIQDYKNLLYRFGIFLHEFLYHQEHHSTETEASCGKLIKMLVDLGISVLPEPDSTIKQWTVVTDEKNGWAAELCRLIIFIRESYSSSHERLYKKHLTLFDHLCTEANTVTTKAVKLQNAVRKNILRRVKYSQYSSVKLTKYWVELTETLCHEKATWNFPESYPRDWKLDSTEGPARIRKKMMRCNLDIPGKFFMSHLSRPGKLSAPLQEILLDKDVDSPLSHIVESLHEDENLLFTCHALFITPTVEQKGEFLICKKRLYFIGEEMTSQIGNSVPIVITRCWQNDVITEFHLRRYRLKDCALEIFAQSGSAFIVFDCEKDRKQVVTNLGSLTYPNMKRKSKLKDFTMLWRDGTLTNFEYLTQLNKYAGRSFSDLMQYPIFPFILKNYDSTTLDISDPEIYRDLRRPVPIQSKDREQYFKSTYENTAQMCPDGPYHYSSHYSNSGIVLYYMIRVPPFTQVFLDFQDGNFDVPDRAFHTLGTTWKLASSDSTTAIRELIPEFFFLPETFENSQGFNLGLRQNDEIVNHVELPKWCQSNPRRFVLIHRALLESPLVTKNLQHWVDLIFGYKQSGKAAIEAINVFHPATYFGYDVKVDNDEVAVEARKTMIKTYGQTPLQLLKSAHPKPHSSVLNYTKPLPWIPPVLKEVTGIHWGEYALSPSDPNPAVIVCRTLHEKLVRLEPLWENEMAVLQSNTTVYCLNPGYKAPNIYTISWGHNDGILRSRRFENSTFHPVICHPTYNQVSCGAVIERHLWVGTECGQVMVYVLGTDSEELSLAGSVLKHPLVAHSGRITNMVISKEFKVAFTGGEDGMVALWDTKWLTYIRSVTIAGSAVNLLAVSGTLGDWVVVCNASQSSSILKYYTINAQFIDSIATSSVIECVTFSNAPEGRNVNVIAACLADRTIRLYSTWDLSEVKVIDVTNLAKGLGISLKYTADNASLCMITKSHFLVVWKTSQKKSNDPKFSLSIR